MLKVCSKCKQEKPFELFHKASKSKDGRQSACKECMKVSYQNCRAAKLDHYNSVRLAREHSNAERFNEWKAQQKCACCGEDDVACLDLHHLDPTEKEDHVSNLTRSRSWEKLMEEINKCIVVCANCHRKIHAGHINLLRVA